MTVRASISSLCRTAATMAAVAAIAVAVSGCASDSLRDSIAKGGNGSVAVFRANVAKLPPLKAVAESPETRKWTSHHQSGVDCSFALPHEDEEIPIAPLERNALIGDWCAVYHTFERSYESSNGGTTKYYVTKAEQRYSFRADGTYRLVLLAYGKVARKASGRWTYSNGHLDLTDSSDKNWHGEYRVDWYGRNDMAIRCRTNETGANLVLAALATSFPTAKYKSECKFWYDTTGCQRIVREHVSKYHFVHGDAIETPHRFHRSGAAKPVAKAVAGAAAATGTGTAAAATPAAVAPAKPYTIISCTRENGSDFAYRFVLELADGANAGLETFRTVQQDFRAAVSEDYAEAFSLGSSDGLYVDFPEFELRDGKIEGRAVVLTIKVASLVYNANTRSGKLAVHFSANQFEDARLFVRRNIEVLARDKNIALVTGEIPEKARFYLGREEIKNGDTLEIEFKTE